VFGILFSGIRLHLRRIDVVGDLKKMFPSFLLLKLFSFFLSGTLITYAEIAEIHLLSPFMS
jgi:hypothetical protein